MVGPTGRVVPPRDPAALAAAWAELLALGPAGRAALGAAARRRVAERYELAAVTRRYEALYEQLAPRATRVQTVFPAVKRDLSLVDRIRSARPDLALSTDLIVGFPGEIEADFQATLDIVEQVGFAQAYTFKYSPRPGTPAALIPEQIAEDVKIDRLHRLQGALNLQQTSFNSRCVGRILPVLFDRRGRKPGQLIGRSPYLQAVHAEADSSALGCLLPVEIRSAGPNSLAGVVARGPSGAGRPDAIC